MTLLPNTLNELASQGVTLRVSAKACSTHQLNQLAASAAQAGGRLIVVDANSLSSQQASTLAGLLGERLELHMD